MPSAIPQQTADQVAPFMVSAGVPSSLTPAVFQALDAAGWTVVTKSAGAAVVTLDRTPCERVAIDGVRGGFVVGVQVGQRGWFTWMEFVDDTGATVKTAPVFSSGAGSFLLPAQTTGRWTVGTSAIAGSHTIT